MKIIKLIFVNVIIPLLIIIVGIVVFKKMIGKSKTKENQKKEIIVNNFPVVKVKNFNPIDANIKIVEYGTVIMPDKVELIPRVMGNIIKISDSLFDGNFVKKGEVLAIIDQSDYKLAIKMAEATVAKSKVDLMREEEEGKIAKAEWDLYKKRYKDAKPSKLRLRIPQIEIIKAALKASEANLSKAKLALSRTVIRAPFDAKVAQKYLSKGQFVATGSKIARLQSVEKAYIKLYLKDSDLKLIPNILNPKNIKVDIEVDFAGKKIKKEGRVISVGSTLNKMTRMLELTVEVKKPYKDLENPLIEGMYAKLTLNGKKFSNVYKIPESFIYKNNVLVYNNGILNIKKVKVLSLKNGFYTIRGISKDDKVIVSSLVDPIEGMKLELEGASLIQKIRNKKKEKKASPNLKEGAKKENKFKNQKSSRRKSFISKEFTIVNDEKSTYSTTKFEDFRSC